MSPPKPPRPGSHSAIDVVAPGAVNEYREASFGERPTVPPIPHDAVPRAQAVPRKPTQRGAPAPASERRPPMSNPPPEDDPPLARPRARQASQREIQIEDAPEGDRPSRIEQEQFGRAVHAKYGKASFSGPAWVFLLLLVAGLLFAVIYLLVTRQASSGSNADVLAAIGKLDGKVDKNKTDQDNQYALLLQRVNTLDTKDGVKEVELAAILAQLRGNPR